MRTEIINMLETLIKVEITCRFPGVTPTEAEVLEIANRQKNTVGATEEEFEQAILNVHSKINITMDEGILIKSDEEFEQWYDARRADLSFDYWKRYREYLLFKKKWSENVVNTVDKVSNDVMALLGDPKKKGSWKRRGLIIGDVQSGKTANFTAICNKAVDVGYRVIIILTGTLENLRKQTQERQDSDLVGLESYFLLNDNGKENKYIGVGEFNSKIRLMTFTSTRNDFKSVIVQSIGLSLTSCKDTALFVVKKNKTVLENLEKWLKVYNADANGKIDSSVLIIDDEADNASVNTKEEENPTTINRCIRNLLKCFTKESYLAVTATPYANIFINDEAEENVKESFGQDLFPKDFIYCLSAPSNYIGAKDIYLENGKHHDCLEIIDDAEIVLPLKHKSGFVVEDIPDTLREAVYFFILANAIMDYRKKENTHRSMLVNVSRFTNVQNQYASYLEEWMEEIKRNTNNFANLSFKESMRNVYIKDLYHVWDKFNLESSAKCDWEKIRSEYLAKAIFTIKVQAVNQSSSSKNLDYSAFKNEGYRVIAVGGNSLSRGITLEGLCASYFYRNSQAYDTLMQMGRWFGFRDGYEDLFKIWMTPAAIDWYQTICEATEELKDEIRRMNNKHLTPKEFGLRIRENPASLIVTARNKMKNTDVVERYIDVSGRVIETVSIDCKTNIFKENYEIIKQALKEIGGKFEIWEKSEIIKDISKSKVLEILKKFHTSYRNIFDGGYNEEAITEYIEKANHLEKWDIVIPSGSIKEKVILEVGENTISINKEKRKLRYLEENKCINVYKTNGRIITGDSLKVGLTNKKIEELLNQEDNKDSNVSNSSLLYEGRNPLLYIHFIDANEVENLPEGIIFPNNTFVALSIGFPMTSEYDGKKAKVRYRINMVAIKQMFDFEDGDEE